MRNEKSKSVEKTSSPAIQWKSEIRLESKVKKGIGKVGRSSNFRNKFEKTETGAIKSMFSLVYRKPFQ